MGPRRQVHREESPPDTAPAARYRAPVKNAAQDAPTGATLDAGVDAAQPTDAPHRGFTVQDWGLLGGAALIWSASFVLIAAGLKSYSSPQVAWGRIFFGFCALSVFAKSRQPIERADWPRVALLGVLWMAIPLNLFALAESWIDTSVAGMLNAGMPVFTIFIGWGVLRRGPHPNEWKGVLVGMLGVIAVAAPTVSGNGEHQLLGVACCVVAVTCYGAAAHLNVPLVRKYGSLPVLWRSQLVAVLVTLPFALAIGGRPHPRFGPTLAVVVLGAVGTGLAYEMAARLLGRVGAVRGSIITYLIPPLSVLWGVLFYKEAVHPLAMVGTAAILLGAWITGRPDNSETELANA